MIFIFDIFFLKRARLPHKFFFLKRFFKLFLFRYDYEDLQRLFEVELCNEWSQSLLFCIHVNLRTNSFATFKTMVHVCWRHNSFKKNLCYWMKINFHTVAYTLSWCICQNFKWGCRVKQKFVNPQPTLKVRYTIRKNCNKKNPHTTRNNHLTKIIEISLRGPETISVKFVKTMTTHVHWCYYTAST